MDPLSMMFMQMAGNASGAATAGAGMVPPVGPAGATPPGGGMGDLSKIMAGVKAPEATKPVFSGGVSGVGLPFLQSMPNILNPAITGAAQRMNSVPMTPSLGQLLMGGR